VVRAGTVRAGDLIRKIVTPDGAVPG